VGRTEVNKGSNLRLSSGQEEGDVPLKFMQWLEYEATSTTTALCRIDLFLVSDRETNKETTFAARQNILINKN
jgi:hypothetical protein